MSGKQAVNIDSGYSTVDVNNLEQPIKFTLPYYGEAPINELACAYFDTEADAYVELTCSSTAHNIGILNSSGKSMKCCTNHATAFTVMERALLEPVGSNEE